jgi:hypothetical protein
MIDKISKLEEPLWLTSVRNGAEDFRLADILKDSLYYPACGLNGTPVKFLSGNIYSFVYADYAMTLDAYLENLNGSSDGCGFKGYKSIFQREIMIEEIVPRGWAPKIVPPSNWKLNFAQAASRPFGHWSVWVADAADQMVGGAKIFSFLYFGGEMSAIYQGLYCRLGIRPKALAIIQPGTMGGEWENIQSDEAFFRKVVKSNSAGMPEYLLYGGFGDGSHYNKPCWSDYGGEKLVQIPERAAGLWALKR